MRCLNCHQKGLPLSTEVCPNCGCYLPSLMRYVLPHQTTLGKNDRGEAIYQIDYPLGKGGFGITYQAIHIALEKQVAIKEFYPQEHALREGKTGNLIVPPGKQEIYKRGLDRFLVEGKILAQINNNNVVRVENYFEERETAYLVMELILGDTLREKLNKQSEKCFNTHEVESTISALVKALDAVHQKEIYHLDIKPDNILITDAGELKLVDFGASRQGLSSGTTSQAFSFDYAPLEVIAGRNDGARSDIFEVGMMLYEMLTGKLPPRAIDRHYDGTWQPEELGKPWQSLITTALELRAEKRPSNIKSWWENRYLSEKEPEPEPKPPRYLSEKEPEPKPPVIEIVNDDSKTKDLDSKSKVEEIHPDEWGRSKGLLGRISSFFDDK